MDFDVIKRLLAALEREHVRYAVFGAVAMGLHGLARFTEDLDIFVAPETTNIGRLRGALRSVVDDPEIEQITAADLLGGSSRPSQTCSARRRYNPPSAGV